METLRPRQNVRHFADAIMKCISLNENARLWNKISMKYVLRGLIDNMAELIKIMARRRPDDKPLSKPMMLSINTYICVTRPHWVEGRLNTSPGISWGCYRDHNWVRPNKTQLPLLACVVMVTPWRLLAMQNKACHPLKLKSYRYVQKYQTQCTFINLRHLCVRDSLFCVFISTLISINSNG